MSRFRNNSLSELDDNSNSQKVLCQISAPNIQPHFTQKCLPLKGKEESIRSGLSSKKSKGKVNKENIKEIDDGVLRMISHTNVNRHLQEKSLMIKQQTSMIEQQKGQIAVLKQCVMDIKAGKLVVEAEEERQKQVQIGELRQLERDYSQNLREFQMMKEHLRDIRTKYELSQRQK